MPDATGLPGLLSDDFATTPRSRVRRHPERAHYDRAAVYAILDAALLAHIGYVMDGKPYVTPTLFRLDGDRLFWHGSSASRLLRTQRSGIPVCATVSHLDRLVAARSAFRHSLNYRSVMVFGTAAAVVDDPEKEAGLNPFIERLYPGRTGLMRAILPQELQATKLIGMTIEEASAKIRDGARRRLRSRHRQQPRAKIGKAGPAMGEGALADHLAVGIDQTNPVRLAWPVDASEPSGIVGHRSLLRRRAYRDACHSLYWRSRRDSPRDLHRGQPAEARVPPRCSKHRGPWVALDKLARSHQSKNQTGLWTR